MAGTRSVFVRMFDRPSGLPGRIGAILMARLNAPVAAAVLESLEVEPSDAVLEVGFGPGVGIERAAELASSGYVAGVDVSQPMVDRARRRNADAVEAGLVDLRQGSAEDLPFEDGAFDAAFAINTVHAWADQAAGVSEMVRVLAPGGRVALVSTKHAGRPDEPLAALLGAAGFERVHHRPQFDGEFVLGRKPEPR